MPKWVRDGAHLLRVLAVVMAIACQISAGGAVPADGETAALAAASIFCQSASQKGTHDLPAPHRHRPDQGIVGVAAVDGQFAVILREGPCLPSPDGTRIGKEVLPGARAQPALLVAASFPRGPPTAI